MATYYPIEAAAKHAGVRKRAVERWIAEGIQIDGVLVRLQCVTIENRRCIEEGCLHDFTAARHRYREDQKRE
ncbi:unnamed protein product, partial [marine sediment metagenome]